MSFEQFVYPPYSIPLIQAYDGLFDSVFVLLHPFIRMPQALSWAATKHYPEDDQILASGTRFSWAQVAEQTGLRSCSQINQALLTSIGALDDYLCDYPARDTLQRFLETSPIWMPTEGRFELLLLPNILDVFRAARFNELIFVAEFPQADPRTDPVRSVPLAGLQDNSIQFPTRGTLVAPDASFLFTVDWDSFFTLFYGPRAFLDQITRKLGMEGFFAGPITEHAWFNYTMGCATVTLSPEHWPTL